MFVGSFGWSQVSSGSIFWLFVLFFSIFLGFRESNNTFWKIPPLLPQDPMRNPHDKSLCVKSLTRHQVNYNGFEAEKKKKIEKTEATIDPSELGLVARILKPPWWVAMGGGFFGEEKWNPKPQ